MTVVLMGGLSGGGHRVEQCQREGAGVHDAAAAVLVADVARQQAGGPAGGVRRLGPQLVAAARHVGRRDGQCRHAAPSGIAQPAVDLPAGHRHAGAAALQLAQQTQWRNKAVSDLYEPGSVFKLAEFTQVLTDNSDQNDLMGTSRSNSASLLAVHARQIREFVNERGLNRELEALPSNSVILDSMGDPGVRVTGIVEGE